MRRGALLLLVLAVGACDGVFEPDLEGAPAAALFGTLDGRTTRQAIRVQILGAPLLDTPDALPGTVTSTELRSGRTTLWRDSLITLATGERAHLFVADLAVRPGETHRIEAVRDADGGRSTVELRIPNPTATPGEQGGSGAVRVAVADLPGRATGTLLRYRVRRPDGTGDTTLVAPATIERTGDDGSFLAFLAEAERRAVVALGNTPPAAFVEAQLETVVSSVGGVPVVDGVGEVGWVVPVVVPVPFSAASLVAVGFVDGR